MPLTTVHVRLPAGSARLAVAVAVRAVLVRDGGNPLGFQRAAGGLARAALRWVRRWFLQRSAGGTDDAGMGWAPLSPLTIRSRLASQRTPAGGRQVGFEQIRQWRASAGLGEIQSLQRYLPVPILIETGKLFRSLDPLLVGDNGRATDDDAIAGLATAGIYWFGTRVAHAKYHHQPGGLVSPADRPLLPRRPLWPPLNRWPGQAMDDMAVALRDGVVKGVAERLAVARWFDG